MLEIEDPTELAKEDEEMEEPVSSFVSTTENFVDDDDLQESLKRARRLTQKSKARAATNSIQAIATATREARLRDEEAERTEEQPAGGLVISATTEFIRDLDDSALLTNSGDFPTSRIPSQPKAFSEIRNENGGENDKEGDEDEVMADYVAERTPMSEKESFSRGSSVEPSNSESVRSQALSFLFVCFRKLTFHCASFRF